MAAITNDLKPALCIGLTLMSVLSCAAWSISADGKEFGRTGGSYTLEISNESYAPLF